MSNQESSVEEPLKEDECTTRASPDKKAIEPKDCDVLFISNVLTIYSNVDKLISFIREITKSPRIIDHISFLIYVKPNLNDKSNSDPVNSGGYLIKFTNAYFCNLAYKEWSSICEKKNIKLEYDLNNLFLEKKHYKKNFLKSKHKLSNIGQPPLKRQKVFRDFLTSNESDNNETYGLSMQFLNNLNIKLPIGNVLFINNLNPDVTVEKIREVFSFAGQVVHVSLQKQESYYPPRLYAKVHYDHPVEAVQAISMFNNQKLYSWTMVVRMDTKPTNDIPEGLSGVGPGLGPNGEPLRGIRNYIELQSIKHLALEKDKAKDIGGSSTNMLNFSPFWQSDKPIFNPMSSNSLGVQTPMVPQMSMPPVPVPTPMPIPVQAPNQQNMNQFGQQPMINPFSIPALQNLQMLQNPVNLQQAVNMLLQSKMNSEPTAQSSDQGGSNNSEWKGQSNQNNNQSNYSISANKDNLSNDQSSDYGNRNHSSDRYEEKDHRDSRKSRDDDRSSKENSDMLLFKNLPRSVTLQALRNKMQEVGDVKFAEMTGQGRAIVRFNHGRDAERCIKLFHKSKVDGQVIEVRYF